MSDEENTMPAFEVIDTKTGHRWMIYADGRTEGLGNSVVIINRIPLLEAKAATEVLGHG